MCVAAVSMLMSNPEVACVVYRQLDVSADASTTLPSFNVETGRCSVNYTQSVAILTVTENVHHPGAVRNMFTSVQIN